MPLCNANPVPDKKIFFKKKEDRQRETKGERERGIRWKGALTCLTCQVHILLKIRLREGGRVGREGNTMSVCKYIHYISSRTDPMSDWNRNKLNGYAVSSDSDVLICLYRRRQDLLPWWRFRTQLIRNVLYVQEQNDVTLSHARNVQFSFLYRELGSNKKRKYKKFCLMAHTTATLFTMCISSLQQVQIQTLREMCRTLWSFARYVMLLYASSVASVSSERKTGTEIYTAAKLLSAVPGEAKLCHPQAESFLRLEKEI